jgi:hypothetical protein
VTGLPLAIYRVLRIQAPARRTISYKDLCLKLAKRGWKVHWRSRKLWMALGDVVVACQSRDLGALPALVIRRNLGRPGASYYPVAHRKARTLAAKITAWKNELTKVAASWYPVAI